MYEMSSDFIMTYFSYDLFPTILCKAYQQQLILYLKNHPITTPFLNQVIVYYLHLLVVVKVEINAISTTNGIGVNNKSLQPL